MKILKIIKKLPHLLLYKSQRRDGALSHRPSTVIKSLVHLYFCKWQKRLFKDSVRAHFHLSLSTSVESVCQFWPLELWCVHSSFPSYSLGRHVTSGSELKSGSLMLPCLSVNIHISSSQHVQQLSLVIQHTTDLRGSLDGTKSQSQP